MRSRVVLLAASAVLALPAASHAAPVCNLLVDKVDDASVRPEAASVYKNKPLDIRSFDVATGKKTLVAVLRVGSTKPADDPITSAAGLTWTVNFTVKESKYAFSRKLDGSGKPTDTATADGAPLSGVSVAMTGDTITWTAPRAAISKLRGSGVKIGGFFVRASTPGVFDQAPDTGYASENTYADGAKSCVKAS